jgi:hypothetical protein
MLESPVIRNRWLLLVVLMASGAWALDEPDGGVADVHVPDGGVLDTTTVEHERTPFEALTERFIGSASRAVRFDWRNKSVGFGLVTSGLLELNSFASARLGGFARFPNGNLLIELAFTRVIVWGSNSTEVLAQTPYRQSGRPNRFELDLNFSYVLAEGVVTPKPGFFPPVQMAFSATAGLRYLLYTEIFKNLNAGEVVGAILSPALSQKEVDNLEVGRLPAMQIDRGRYSVLLGFTLDLYFQPGFFVSPRVMLAVPIFGGLTNSGLGAWWELSASFGWML